MGDENKNIKRQNKGLSARLSRYFNEHKQKPTSINKRGGGVFVTINETDLKGSKKTS